MLKSLQSEFAEIDAHHAVYQKQRAQIRILTILLRLERKQRVSLREKWELRQLYERYPDLQED